MDTGRGEFAHVNPEEAQALKEQLDKEDIAQGCKPKKRNMFHVGMEIDIEGSRFKIQSIGNRCMVLRLLPQ